MNKSSFSTQIASLLVSLGVLGLSLVSPGLTAHIDEEPMDDRGRPGRQSSGDRRGTCPLASQPIRAAIPDNFEGRTAQAQPTLWVFSPYSEVRGEFVLQDENDFDVDRIPLVVDEAGWVRLQTQTVLASNRWYQWYFKVYCQEGKPPLFVRGWIQRVEPNGETELWYDLVDEILQNPDGRSNELEELGLD
ncbi:MAG: DUF928 domain-containing protein [Cyanobacteriota bacterium]|nr:DUF928 domain-containing protein [Cyanobacteriota bacterium]